MNRLDERRKTFIMLAGPGMIGKSTAAKTACNFCASVSILDNDYLMQEIFEALHLPRLLPISDVEEWCDKVNAAADCNRLVQLYHRDFVACHWQSSVIFAEGYPYMLHWYREQVYEGLSCLGYEFDYRLVKYNSFLSEQAERRASKYADLGWSIESQDFHKREIQKQWNKFQMRTASEQNHVQFHQMDGNQLRELVKSISDSFV